MAFSKFVTVDLHVSLTEDAYEETAAKPLEDRKIIVAQLGTDVLFRYNAINDEQVYWVTKPHGSQVAHEIDVGEESLLDGYGTSGRFYVEVNSTLRRHDLAIKDVRQSDAGTHICIDERGHGQKAYAELIIDETAAKPLEDRKIIVAQLGTDVLFRYNARNDERVYWVTKPHGSQVAHGIDIEEESLLDGYGTSGRFYVEVNSTLRRHDLAIKDVRQSDAGTYICRPIDERGHGEKAYAELIIYGVANASREGTSPSSDDFSTGSDVNFNRSSAHRRRLTGSVSGTASSSMITTGTDMLDRLEFKYETVTRERSRYTDGPKKDWSAYDCAPYYWPPYELPPYEYVTSIPLKGASRVFISGSDVYINHSSYADPTNMARHFRAGSGVNFNRSGVHSSYDVAGPEFTFSEVIFLFLVFGLPVVALLIGLLL